VAERSPENKEAPNKSELKPKDRAEAIRKLGQAAVKGSQKGR
jgi:hypothetical protein